ncbi:hypothetical protein [Halomonas sp. ND22Bw]
MKPIFLFTRDELGYRTRLPMTKIAENIARANYDRELSRAIEEAIATAR